MDRQQTGDTRLPQAGVAQPQQRRPRFSWTALLALVVATTAVVMSIIGLVRSGSSSAGSMSAPGITTSAAADTSAADRALCMAIAPLMAEDDRASNTWRNTGDPATPARDGALPKYRSDTEDWARRIQPMLDEHQDANSFFRRTLQRFVDDRILYVRNARPGPPEDYDNEVWADSLSAYGGPLSICNELDVKW